MQIIDQSIWDKRVSIKILLIFNLNYWMSEWGQVYKYLKNAKNNKQKSSWIYLKYRKGAHIQTHTREYHEHLS
jgi:hypothetical protein